MSKRKWHRSVLVAGTLLCVVATPSTASASAEKYTLDGKPVSAAVVASAGACAAIADARGVIACFSSQAGLLKAQAAAVRRGSVPPGWGFLPTDVSREALSSKLETEARASTSTSKLKPSGGDSILHDHSGSYCYGYTNIHIWTDSSWTGAHGNIGPTNGWYNLSSSWNNAISSYRNSNYYSTWFSDYANGSGASYGRISACWWNRNLGRSTMSDGGTANDRFTAAYVGG